MSVFEADVARSRAAMGRSRPESGLSRLRASAASLLAIALVSAATSLFATPVACAQGREPRTRTYAVGAGLRLVRFRASDGARMGASGPALDFDYAIGRRWGFGVRGSFMFPLHGSQALEGQGGDGVNLRANYGSGRSALDLTLLVLRRLHLNEHLDLVVGGGVHVQTLRLVSATYEPIELITGGLGALARLERSFGSRFFYGGELGIAFDPIDFVHHTHRSVFAAPIALAVLVGVRR